MVFLVSFNFIKIFCSFLFRIQNKTKINNNKSKIIVIG